MTSKYMHKVKDAFEIKLSTLSSYTDVSTIMKQRNIKHYVYCFVFDGIIVKYGASTGGKMHGERIYRQAGHLSGWGQQLTGSSGSDMRVIADKFIKQHGINLARDNMSIFVIDMHDTMPEDRYTHPMVLCEELERDLIDACIEFHGKAPIGNSDYVSKWHTRVHRGNKQFNRLFEIQD